MSWSGNTLLSKHARPSAAVTRLQCAIMHVYTQRPSEVVQMPFSVCCDEGQLPPGQSMPPTTGGNDSCHTDPNGAGVGPTQQPLHLQPRSKGTPTISGTRQ